MLLNVSIQDLKKNKCNGYVLQCRCSLRFVTKALVNFLTSQKVKDSFGGTIRTNEQVGSIWTN